MASEDVYQFQDWLKSGQDKKGRRICRGNLPWNVQARVCLAETRLIEGHGGRVAGVSRTTQRYLQDMATNSISGIETSANINTNPRTENGCITIDKEIYFYKEYPFDGIVSFE